MKKIVFKSNWDWFLRDVHSNSKAAKFESIDSSVGGPGDIRRGVGLLFALDIQLERDGKGSDQRGGQSGRSIGQKVQHRAQRLAQTLTTGQVSSAELSTKRQFFHFGPWRHRRTRAATLLRASIRCLQAESTLSCINHYRRNQVNRFEHGRSATKLRRSQATASHRLQVPQL